MVVTIAETANNTAASAEKTFIIVDYRALNAKLSEVATLDQATYTTASWTAFVEAKAAAQAVADDIDALQADIDAQIVALGEAETALVERGDKTALTALLSEVATLDQATYTTASWTAFVGVKTAAQAVADDIDALQADIDAAKVALGEAKDALVEKANFAELATAVEAAEAVELNKYISTGKTTFQSALAAAQAILADDATAQADIDEAKAALEAAQAALVLKGDKTELNALLAEAATLVEGDYTPDSWTAFATAKEEAQAVADNADATQADVDAAKTALETAKAALAEKSGLSCGATMPVGVFAMLAVLGAGMFMKKKKED